MAGPSRLPGRKALLAMVTLAACGGGGGGGTAPTSTAPTAVTDLRFTLTPEVGNRSVAEFSWSGGQGATSFRLEVGSSSGASNVAVIDTGSSQTQYRYTPVPIGNLYARVGGRNATGAGPVSAEVLVGSVDPRELIEALLLGSGRLAVAGSRGCSGGAMLGWRPGTQLDVLVSTNLDDTLFVGAQQTVPQFATGTRGQVRAAITRVSHPPPRADVDEITMRRASQAEVDQVCRNPGVRGCADQAFSGRYFRSVEIVIAPSAEPSTLAHELGHALGLCHAIVAAGLEPPLTMGVTPDGAFSPIGRLSRLSPASHKAIETVYAAGLFAGSTRPQFEAAGLVPRTSAATLPGARAGGVPGVPREGETSHVLKPFCEAGVGALSP